VHGIEHQSVIERPSAQVLLDCSEGITDVRKSFLIASTHSGIDSATGSVLTLGRKLSAGTTSTFP